MDLQKKNYAGLLKCMIKMNQVRSLGKNIAKNFSLGVIELREMVDIVGTIYELQGFPVVQWRERKMKKKCNCCVQEQAVERAHTRFLNLDLNGNGEITEDEFIKGCLEDDYFITTLERARR